MSGGDGRTKGFAVRSMLAERNSRQSLVLVTGQLGVILLLLLTGPVLPRHPVSAGLFGGGLLLVGWAVAAMGPGRVKVRPEPGKHARLVTAGPYRWIRHPMYASTLVITAAWLLEGCSWVRGLGWLVLAGVLVLKVRHEERLLRVKFPEYAAYARRTKRLVPFVY